MIGVSGLLYRMKQNAVGLASITILACGVLVMISTTISLYAGTEDSLKRNFHNQLMIAANYKTNNGEDHMVSFEELQKIVEEVGDSHGLTLKEAHTEQYLEVTYVLKEQELMLKNPSIEEADQLAISVYITAEEYEKMTGEVLHLSEDEIAICAYDAKDAYTADTLKIGEKDYKVVHSLDSFPIAAMYNMQIVTCYGIVLPSQSDLETIYEAQHAFYEMPSEYIYRLAAGYQEEISRNEGTDLTEEIRIRVFDFMDAQENITGECGYSSDSIWDAAENMYGMYGTLFFLGLILGFVFLFATALIIYYKQISEGYEDRERFQIMSKIGLSDEEAKKSISGQILLVFFLPLVVSGIHLAAAFPMLLKLLMILQLGNPDLFIKCTLFAYAGFAIIYTGIYVMTAKIYYRIIS